MADSRALTIQSGIYKQAEDAYSIIVGAGVKAGGAGSLTLAAAGTNQNVVLTPSGSGYSLINGSVGIGTTTPAFKLTVAGASAATTSAVISASATATDSGVLSLEHYRGTLASPTANSSGDTLGVINFVGYTNQRCAAARITGYATGGWGGSGADSPGVLTFSTSPDASATPVEHLRIDDAGKVGIGSTSPTEKLDVNGAVKIGTTSGTNAGSLRWNGNGAYFEGYNGSQWTVLDPSSATKEPTGFTSRAQSTLAFTNTSPDRTLAITPVSGSFEYFIKGKRYSKTGADTVQITATEGLWHFYYDGATLTANQSLPTNFLFDYAYVASIYWDNTNTTKITLNDERHGLTMDWATHQYLHYTVGSRFASGLTLVSKTGNIAPNVPGTLGDEKVAMTGGTIYDEDIKIDIVHSASPASPFEQVLETTAYIPVFWRTGANGYWRKTTAADRPFDVASNIIQYNKYATGTWSESPPSSGNFVAYWVYATDNQDAPVVAIMGQREDTSLPNAKTNNTPESLSLGSLLTQEMKLIFRIIYQYRTGYTNIPTGLCAIHDITDYRTVTSLPGSSFVATSHSSLTGLTNDDHPQYAFLAGRATSQILIGGTVADETLTLQGNAATSSNTATSANLVFKVGDSGGTQALTILNNGNVGIGRTDPGAKLDVKGVIRLSGSSSGYVGIDPGATPANQTYTLPTAYPTTSGYALVSTDAGVMSWVAASTGAVGQPVFTTFSGITAAGVYTSPTENVGLAKNASTAQTVIVDLSAAVTAGTLTVTLYSDGSSAHTVDVTSGTSKREAIDGSFTQNKLIAISISTDSSFEAASYPVTISVQAFLE